MRGEGRPQVSLGAHTRGADLSRERSDKRSAVTPSVGVQQSARNCQNQRAAALMSAGFRLWEQEVPGGGSHRAHRARCSV
jgi:hypothetical protein